MYIFLISIYDYVHINVKRSMRGVDGACNIVAVNKYDFEKINILEYAFGEGGGGTSVIKKRTLCTLS